MNPISHLLAGAAIPLVLVVAGCDKPAGTSAGRDPDRGGVVPAAGTVESRPLPVRAVRAEGEALFEALPAGRTGIDYGMHWDDPASVLKEFIFLNPSGGICAGDYDDDGLPDLYITSPSGGNRLYRNTGGFKFEDVTKAAGVSDPGFWGTGASFVDIDDDGDLDLYACGYTRPNKLYINDGTGRFVDRAAEVGLDFNGGSMMMSFTDIDNDGDLDGYLATTAVAPPPGTDFRVKFVPRESDGKEIPVVIPGLSVMTAGSSLMSPGWRGSRVLTSRCPLPGLTMMPMEMRTSMCPTISRDLTCSTVTAEMVHLRMSRGKQCPIRPGSQWEAMSVISTMTGCLICSLPTCRRAHITGRR